VHLVEKWLPSLDKKMEASFEHPHANYRIFISAGPASNPLYHIIPQVILFKLNNYTIFLNVQLLFVFLGRFRFFNQNY